MEFQLQPKSQLKVYLEYYTYLNICVNIYTYHKNLNNGILIRETGKSVCNSTLLLCVSFIALRINEQYPGGEILLQIHTAKSTCRRLIPTTSQPPSVN